MEETEAVVLDIKVKGLDFPTIITVEYKVNGVKYTLKESLKYKKQLIKLGFLPIGQKLIPKVKCKIGDSILVEYNREKPEEGHIKGNDGILNC